MNEEQRRRAPPIYRAATPRAVLPKDGSGIGISFDLDGETVRMFLPLDAAERFCDALRESLEGENGNDR